MGISMMDGLVPEGYIMDYNLQYTKIILKIVDQISLEFSQRPVQPSMALFKYASDRCKCLRIRDRNTVRTKGKGPEEQGQEEEE